LSILKLQNAVSLAYRENCPSLISLIKVVPRLVDNILIQQMDDQWRNLPIALEKHPNEDIINLPVDTFWQVQFLYVIICLICITIIVVFEVSVGVTYLNFFVGGKFKNIPIPSLNYVHLRLMLCVCPMQMRIVSGYFNS